jgi:hypothetical protein
MPGQHGCKGMDLHGELLLWVIISLPARVQGGRVEIGAPTGRWQMVVIYRGRHDPLCLTYLAALQVKLGVGGWGGRGFSGIDYKGATGLHIFSSPF